jgi:hypothetical protein
MKVCCKVCIVRNLTKGRRDCSGEQIREGKFRRENEESFKEQESLNFLSKLVSARFVLRGRRMIPDVKIW